MSRIWLRASASATSNVTITRRARSSQIASSLGVINRNRGSLISASIANNSPFA
jgi:hypothetical protein